MDKGEKQEIIDKTFSNLCFAIVIGSFLYFLNLGYVNIKEHVFLTDLMVFGILVAIMAIFVFERAYKLDDDELAMQGIEIFVLGIIVLGLQLVLKNAYPFIAINSIIILAVIGYYIIKTFVSIHIKKKKI